MSDIYGESGGEALPLDGYLDDFEQRLWAIDRFDFWKLERRQSFLEPGSASWEAFARGDWDEALTLIVAREEEFKQRLARAAERGFRYFRVRIVQEPVTPYLQWELNLLNARAECGENIRVVSVEQVKSLEKGGLIPEMATLGADVAYRIRYDEAGVLTGADRYTDVRVVERCREFIESLYGEGADLVGYFAEHIAGLAPPQP